MTFQMEILLEIEIERVKMMKSENQVEILMKNENDVKTLMESENDMKNYENDVKTLWKNHH